MTTLSSSKQVDVDMRQTASKKRIDDVGWGLFLVMTGVIWLLSDERVPAGTWLIGTGVLLLAISATRRLNGIAINLFTTVLGALVLAGGVAELRGVTLPWFAIGLVFIGAIIILKPLIRSTA